MGKNDFKHLNQEFDSKVLYLLKQRGFLSYEYISGFQRFKKKTKKPQKTVGNKLLIKVSDKEYEHVFKFWDRF